MIPNDEVRLARINDRMFNFARPIDESPSELDFILDFRSVLHETEHVKFVDLYNPGPKTLKYRWKITHSEEDNGDILQICDTNGNVDSSAVLPKMNQVFDVCPLFGELKTGEIQRSAFTFRAKTGIEARCDMVCHVNGGPNYILGLQGRADNILYNLSATEVDFGAVQYDHVHIREIVLTNNGNVDFGFKCDDFEKLLPGEPLVLPSEGFLQAGQAIELKLVYLPGVPNVFEKFVKIQIAHFRPVDIRAVGVSTFCRVMLDLPRDSGDQMWCGLVEKIRQVSTVSK